MPTFENALKILHKYHDSQIDQKEEINLRRLKWGEIAMPLEDELGLNDYASAYKHLDGGLPAIINYAINTNPFQKIHVIDIFSSTSNAVRQLINRQLSHIHIPENKIINADIIGLTDLRLPEEKAQDQLLGIKFHEAIISTPHRLERLFERLLLEGSASLVFSKAGFASNSLADIPEVVGLFADCVWKYLSPYGGTLAFEWEFTASTRSLTQTTERIITWAGKNYRGVKINFNPVFPFSIAISKTPDAPLHLPSL